MLVDGIDTKDVLGQVLQSRITTITQDPVDIYSSLRANIYPFERTGNAPIPDATMVDALSRVGLWETVQSAGGLDADLDALQLSHGQKQLFYLARAILHHEMTGGRLVLVDEATSDIDQETEKRIIQIMEEAFADCTVLTIAHRVETLQNADIIVRLDGGKLVETSSMYPQRSD